MVTLRCLKDNQKELTSKPELEREYEVQRQDNQTWNPWKSTVKKRAEREGGVREAGRQPGKVGVTGAQRGENSRKKMVSQR